LGADGIRILRTNAGSAGNQRGSEHRPAKNSEVVHNLAMSVPTLYLETSVWGSLAARQPRDRKQVVHRLLRLLDGVRGTCVISDVVLAEVQDAAPADTAEIRRRIDATHHTVYPISEPIEALALSYIAAGVLPEGREADALHVGQLRACNSIISSVGSFSRMRAASEMTFRACELLPTKSNGSCPSSIK